MLRLRDPMRPVRAIIDAHSRRQGKEVFKSSLGDLGFASAGDPTKTCVLFIHGSPGSAEGWYHFLATEAWTTNYHFIAIDRPGYGLSRAGIVEPNLDRQATSLSELIQEKAKDQNCFVIAHSYGGATALRLAQTFPSLIRGVAFTASSVAPMLEEVKLIQKIGRLSLIEALTPAFLRVCNQEILALKEELFRIEADWHRYGAKTAIIHGAGDQLVPVENVEYLEKNISPDLIVYKKIIEQEGHFLPWRHPQLYWDALKALRTALP